MVCLVNYLIKYLIEIFLTNAVQTFKVSVHVKTSRWGNQDHTISYTVKIIDVVGKSLKSLNVLLCKCHNYDLTPKTLCQLFDAFVLPILNYSSEIWGYTKSKELEKIHLKFCKRLLGVRVNTCTAAVYGELG